MITIISPLIFCIFLSYFSASTILIFTLIVSLYSYSPLISSPPCSFLSLVVYYLFRLNEWDIEQPPLSVVIQYILLITFCHPIPRSSSPSSSLFLFPILSSPLFVFFLPHVFPSSFLLFSLHPLSYLFFLPLLSFSSLPLFISSFSISFGTQSRIGRRHDWSTNGSTGPTHVKSSEENHRWEYIRLDEILRLSLSKGGEENN